MGTRPTAVNLFWALDRAMAVIEGAYAAGGAAGAAEAARGLADRMKREDAAVNRTIGAHGRR
jgi:methylthioribose-1-phosphate isomerase